MMNLPLPLLEDVLASLPLRSLLSVAAACKSLHSLVSSSSFALLHSRHACRSPWFFFFGFNHLLPHRSQAFAFDPASLSWLRLPLPPPPPHNSSSLSSSHSSLFALSGPRQSLLGISPSPLKQTWQVIPAPMFVGRSRPLLAIFYNDPSKLHIGKIVVAGGVDDYEDADEFAVEEFDTNNGEWVRCEPLPEALRGKSLVSAMAGGRFYVGDREGGTICWREREGGRWIEGKVEKPQGVKGWQWVGSEGPGLMVVAECGGVRLKVYKMEEEEAERGGKMREVAEMPAELCELFKEDGGEETVVCVRSCEGGGNVLYIYSDSPFKEYAACACELGVDGRSSRWFRLPPLPAPLHRFDRVLCLSSSVPLPSCIN